MQKAFGPLLIVLLGAALSAACWLLPQDSGWTFTTQRQTWYMSWRALLSTTFLWAGCVAGCARSLALLYRR